MAVMLSQIGLADRHRTHCDLAMPSSWNPAFCSKEGYVALVLCVAQTVIDDIFMRADRLEGYVSQSGKQDVIVIRVISRVYLSTNFDVAPPSGQMV